MRRPAIVAPPVVVLALLALGSCAEQSHYQYTSIHISIAGVTNEGDGPEGAAVTVYVSILDVNEADALVIPSTVEIGPVGGPLVPLVEDPISRELWGSATGWLPEYEVHVVVPSKGIDFTERLAAPNAFTVSLSPDVPVVGAPLTLAWTPEAGEGPGFEMTVGIETPNRGSTELTFLEHIVDEGTLEVPGESFPRVGPYHMQIGRAFWIRDAERMGARFESVVGVGVTLDRLACAAAGGSCTIPDDCCSATCNLSLTCE
jgi:hypothetical protein